MTGLWRDRTELSDVLRRLFDLGADDQLQAYEQLKAYLEAQGVAVEPSGVADQQASALDMMRQAATHHGLPEGQPPTAGEYNSAYHALGLPWSRNKIGTVFGSWRAAGRAFRGEKPRMTVAQRAIYVGSSGARRDVEGHIECVQTWLKTEPDERNTLAYDEWADNYNQRRQAGTQRMVSVRAMYKALRLRWDEIIAVAERRMSLDEAQGQARSRRLAERGELLGAGEIAELAKTSPTRLSKLRGTDESFPPPAVILGGEQLWDRSDVERWIAGKARVQRRSGFRQDEFVGVAELAELLGHSGPRAVKVAVYRGRAPEASGHAGRVAYWRRDEVLRWRRERGGAHRRIGAAGRRRILLEHLASAPRSSILDLTEGLGWTTAVATKTVHLAFRSGLLTREGQRPDPYLYSLAD